jgi:hypothetical protein
MEILEFGKSTSLSLFPKYDGKCDSLAMAGSRRMLAKYDAFSGHGPGQPPEWLFRARHE